MARNTNAAGRGSARGRTASRDATVTPAQYDAPEGWEVGNRAPSNKYRTLNPDGSYADDKATDEPKPGAYQRQVAVEGDVVTAAMRMELGEDAVPQGAVITTAPAAQTPQSQPVTVVQPGQTVETTTTEQAASGPLPSGDTSAASGDKA